MTAESDVVLQTLRPADELKAILSASHASLSWMAEVPDESADDTVAGLLVGTLRADYLVPNGGWVTSFNAAADADAWAAGPVDVRLMVTRGEEEVELAVLTFAPDGAQQTSLERIQLLAGDLLYVEVVVGAVAVDAEVSVSAVVGLGLFR